MNRLIRTVPIFSLLIGSAFAQHAPRVTSEWTDGTVLVRCESIDSSYVSTDTAVITIIVWNLANHSVYVSAAFSDGPIYRSWNNFGEPILAVDFSLDWWFSSDPLMHGIGPQIIKVSDSVSTRVFVPMKRFKVDPWHHEFLLHVLFAYLPDIGRFGFLLSDDTSVRRRMGAQEMIR